MSIRTVALLGARGNLGPFILRALLSSGKFDVTLLVRSGSDPEAYEKDFPGTRVVILPGSYPDAGGSDELAETLRGQDALVVAIPGSKVNEQVALADASVKAGVKRFVPADFGSVDSSDQICLDLVPLYRNKADLRAHLISLAGAHPTTFSWTALVPGHFLDYGLLTPLLGFDASRRHALIFDDGNVRFSATTRARIGEATAKILEHEHETSNRIVYVQGVCTTQNEILGLLEKAAGGEKWTVDKVESQGYIKEKKREMDEGTGHDPVEEMVAVLGVTRANWEKKETFSNGLFGFKEENLEELVREAWRETMAGGVR